ncbi:KNR4/SMI1 homolog [Nicotiana tomentosiformis]|uniref:KNR4/SMI1 homolog n=1 Tax=Nicotiana tomentosiformis TaxID=4098 RepID=UPI00388CC152
MVGTAAGADLEAPRDGENALNDPLGAIEIGGSPLLSSFSEEMIQEARALKTLSIKGGHGKEDPVHDYFTRVEDVTGLSDLEVSRNYSGEASSLFNEAQQALNRASTLHQEAFSRSRAELSRYEADLRGLTEEKIALRLLCGQREEETKDLRAELAKTHKDQSDLIEQKEGVDHFAAEKETALSQLSSAESQLRGMKEKSSIQAKKIEELEARLASDLAKAKYEAKKAKAEEEVIVVVYRADAEAAQLQAREAAEIARTRAYWIVELAKCQSQRETLEEIHARGFYISNKITKARDHKANAGALASSNDDDDAESKSGFESGEDLDGEETALGENQKP